MLKPYDSYAKTEYDWLGNIPNHWRIERSSSSFSENKALNSELKYKNTLQFKFGEIVPKKTFELDQMLLNIIEKYTIVNPNDIVVNGLNLNYDFVTQRVAIVKESGVITSAYIAITPKETINPCFACYLYKSMDSRKVFNGLGTGIRLTLAYPELKNVKIPIPPREEQDQIVRYLDWKLSQINMLIKAKKKQIALLKEQKQAIINQAVTKGLNPDAEMKDSGVEWLGEIPKDWDTELIKKVFAIKKEIARSEGHDVLSVTQQGLKVKDISKNEGQMAQNYSKYQFVNPGDFVMNHMDLLTGFVDCSKYFGVTSPDYRVFVLRENVDCDKEYLLRILQLCYYRKFFYGLGQGAATQGRWRLPADNFNNFLLPIPIRKEQEAIAEYIRKTETAINRLIDKELVTVKYFDEYRTRLVSDVVTGKVDVRGIEIPAHENEMEETEADAEDESVDDESSAVEMEE